MKRLTFNVVDTSILKRPVVDLLASNESFYILVLDLADRTDNDAGQVELDDLKKFSEYLDEYTTYYPVELLYMVQFAMDDVTERQRLKMTLKAVTH